MLIGVDINIGAQELGRLNDAKQSLTRALDIDGVSKLFTSLSFMRFADEHRILRPDFSHGCIICVLDLDDMCRMLCSSVHMLCG